MQMGVVISAHAADFATSQREKCSSFWDATLQTTKALEATKLGMQA